MHKIVASLLLALATTALLSAAALTSPPSRRATLTTRVLSNGSLLRQHEEAAAAGRYVDLRMHDGMLVSVRLSRWEQGVASIDAIVARDGLTLAEHSIRVTEGASASVDLASPPLTLEFALR